MMLTYVAVRMRSKVEFVFSVATNLRHFVAFAPNAQSDFVLFEPAIRLHVAGKMNVDIFRNRKLQ